MFHFTEQLLIAGSYNTGHALFDNMYMCIVQCKYLPTLPGSKIIL